MGQSSLSPTPWATRLVQWHEIISDSTLTDASFDRLIHNAYKINLKRESMRKKLASLTGDNTPVA
ncbi:hypothetical protein DFAR_3590006 [Desulfarculales bacterium]